MGRHARRLQRVRGAVRKQAAEDKEDDPTQRDQSLVNIHEDNFFRDEIDDFHDAKERLLLEGDVAVLRIECMSI
ncbi:hypothetical protein GBAR_LOCUS20614 [Geodia barretti]|uniref:Uncharacterized protein n=1 Tax=Geodia barretti TaxID=519541 RepID=A0AA35WXS5_GEOBA|nr:hypothetical protein GBAR_LOCUS20614 [Geodia barretti]